MFEIGVFLGLQMVIKFDSDMTLLYLLLVIELNDSKVVVACRDIPLAVSELASFDAAESHVCDRL